MLLRLFPLTKDGDAYEAQVSWLWQPRDYSQLE